MKFNKYKYSIDFTFKNNKIYLTEEGLGKNLRLKKITGSRIGSILGDDQMKTPFQTWCDMFNFYKDEGDRYFLDAGIEIEPKLRKYAEEKMNKQFHFFDPKKHKFDLFPENSVFGGIPDGEEWDSSGRITSILEIKIAQLDKYKWVFLDNQFRLVLENGKPIVAKKGGGLEKWFKNGEVIIPITYQHQLSLYLYLKGKTKGYFCVAFLSQKDLDNPSSVVFDSEFNNYVGYKNTDEIHQLSSAGNILVWKEFNLDREMFEKKIREAHDWYKNHILTGISPELTSSDLEWLRYGYPEIS